MKKITKVFFISFLILSFMSITSISAIESESDDQFKPMIMTGYIEQAKKNTNWKVAFITGEHEQVVFMNISSLTSTQNEIGFENHPFDQVILIVEGSGKVILNDKPSTVKEGDMIFIPNGIKHNIINLNKKNNLKLISLYSENDIPKDAVYKKKADEPKI
jgi:quercetin dioxygenase-like cupin family protein